MNRICFKNVFINFKYKVTLQIKRKKELLLNGVRKLSHSGGFHLTHYIGINSNRDYPNLIAKARMSIEKVGAYLMTVGNPQGRIS